MATINQTIQPVGIASYYGMMVYDLRERYPEMRGQEGELYDRRSLASIEKLIVHHSATATPYDVGGTVAILDAIQRYHQDDPKHRWPAIGYHLVASPSGVFWVNGFDLAPYHTASNNRNTIGLCLLGSFENAPLAEWMHRAIYAGRLLAEVKTKKGLVLAGHHETNPYSTAFCPSKRWGEWKEALAHPYVDEQPSDPREGVRSALASYAEASDGLWRTNRTGRTVLRIVQWVAPKQLERMGAAYAELRRAVEAL